MMKMIVYNIPAMLCYIAGGILALKGIEGWGWFLFIGLLITHVRSEE